jgi:hypothetical protein
MRRQTLLACIILLALTIGASSVLTYANAIAMCSRAMPATSKTQEDHACCHAQFERAGEHSCAMQEAAVSFETEPAPEVAQPVSVAALTQLGEPCAHCVGTNELPVTSLPKIQTNVQPQQQSDTAAIHTTTGIAFPPSASLRRLDSSRGSPPGAQPRLHLINSVFLI